jgi:hypothetical protein
VEVRNFRGVGDFHAFIAALAATAEFRALVTSVGVVRDAEDRPAVQARQSVEAALVNAGLTPARNPPVRTSLFILPDDTNPGMIETLCMEAVRGEPSLAGTHGCITDFFVCLTRNRVACRRGLSSPRTTSRRISPRGPSRSYSPAWPPTGATGPGAARRSSRSSNSCKLCE